MGEAGVKHVAHRESPTGGDEDRRPQLDGCRPLLSRAQHAAETGQWARWCPAAMNGTSVARRPASGAAPQHDKEQRAAEGHGPPEGSSGRE